MHTDQKIVVAHMPCLQCDFGMKPHARFIMLCLQCGANIQSGTHMNVGVVREMGMELQQCVFTKQVPQLDGFICQKLRKVLG